MKISIYKTKGSNAGILEKTEKTIDLKKNNWIDLDRGNTSHPLKYIEPKAFENKNVYFLYNYGKEDSNGVHISLSWWQNQRFKFIQEQHWIQKSENIMWTVNILVAVLAIIATLK